jgi:type I restriction enzyme S subunit
MKIVIVTIFMALCLLPAYGNHNLEEQAKAIFKSWFVDFEPFQDGEFIDTELGQIPVGWQVGTLKDMLDVRYGKDHKKLADGTIPVYGSGGLMRYAEKALYNGESVLIPRKGTLNNVMRVTGEFWTVDTMFYSVPRKIGAAKYLYHILSKLDLASMNSGSAVPSMTTDILNAIKIVLPTDEALKNFDHLTSFFWEKIETNKMEIQKLTQLRDALLPKLMSGEIDVSEVEV